MKRVLNAFNWAWSVYRKPQQFQPSMLKVMEAQFKFLKDTAEASSPRLTHLSTIYWDVDGKEQEIRLLSLWCAVGDKNPIERIEELAKENSRLKLEVSKLLNQEL